MKNRNTLTAAFSSACLAWAAFASPAFAKCEISGDAVHTRVSSVAHFEEEIAKALSGDLVRTNSTIVNPAKKKPTVYLDYSATVKLTKGTDDVSHVAVAALVSDDGCDVSVNGRQWLSQSGKGHDISKGLRRYDRLLLPGDDNRFAIKYSQTFYDPAVLERDLDGLSLIVLPVAIDISVKDSSGKMNERILVKKGETVEAALNPVFWEYDLPSNDDIRWSIGQVDSSGNVTWKQLSETGAKISVPTSTAGIFKLRAEINGQHFYYLRHQDVPHHAGMAGLSVGDDDFIGIYGYGTQKKLIEKAYPYCAHASSKFSYEGTFDMGAYGGWNRSDKFKDSWKCNIFVFVVAYECGMKIALRLRASKSPVDVYESPPTVSEWSSSKETITVAPPPPWLMLNINTQKPEPGFIVTDGGHMGILDYDGSWISAGRDTVNKKACIGTLGDTTYQTSVLRNRNSDK